MVDTSYFAICKSIMQVDAGFTAYACANGFVQTFGDNSYCDLGLGTIINPGGNNNINQVSNINNAIYVDVGSSFSVALLNDGLVKAWGRNDFFQLGNSSFSGNSSCIPLNVTDLCNVKAIAAGGDHSLALLNTGEVVAWGYNSNGQCGPVGVGNTLPHFEYVGISNVKAIAAGSKFSVALKNDGTVWVWGDGTFGQLGNGTTGSTNPIPTQVPGINNVVKIAAGNNHVIVLLNNNTLKLWGANFNGQLGVGNTVSQLFPVTINPTGIVIDIEAGPTTSFYLTATGDLFGAGDNYYSKLGICPSGGNYTTFTFSANIPNAQKLFAPCSYGHSWAITSTGSIMLWGSNYNGQLGVQPQGANTNSCTLNNGPLMIGDGECPANTINEMGGFEPSISYWINVNNATICQGQSAVLTANTNATGGVWLWSTGDNTQSITVSPTTSTTYTVNYILPNGCILSATATVTVNPLPNITITPQNPSICLGQSIVLTASGANNYVWTPNNTLNTNTGAVVTAMPTATTTYTVTGTNAFGCSGSAQTTVSVLPNPTTPVIQGVNNVCTTDPPQIVTYTISNCDPNLTYTWQFLPNGIATIVSNNNCSVNILWNVAMVNAGFGATINVTTSNAGCFSSSSLTVNPCCIPFDIDPNISAWHNNTSVLTTPFTIPVPVIGGTHSIMNTSIAINGTFEIDADLIIDNCTVYFGPDAKINVQQGKMLWIKRNSILKAGCNEMWDGIYVSHPSSVVMIDDSRIQDAENAVYSNNGGNYIIQRNVFDLNHKHLVVNNAANHAGIVVSNQLLCAGTLITPRSGQRTHIAVEINDVLGINIGSAAQPMFLNTIDNADFGIFAKRSTFNVHNNKIENITDAPLLGLKKECPVGTGVCIVGNSAILLPSLPPQPVLTANIGGMAANELNNLKACEYGIMASLATHLNIYKNTLNFIAQTAVQVSSNSLRNVNILQNSIIDAYTGVHALNNRRCTLNINQNAIAAINTNAIYLQNNSQGGINANSNSINNASRGVLAQNNTLSVVNFISNSIQYPSVSNTCPNVNNVNGYNVLGSCGEGIYASETNTNSGAVYTIQSNLIRNYTIGISTHFLNKASIKQNQVFVPVTATSNFNNIKVRRGIELIEDKNADVWNNTIQQSSQAITGTNIGGVYASLSSNSFICSNTIRQLGYGLQANKYMPSRVTHNTMQNLTRGIWLANNGIIDPQGSPNLSHYNKWIGINEKLAVSGNINFGTHTNGLLSPFYVKTNIPNQNVNQITESVIVGSPNQNLNAFNGNNKIPVFHAGGPNVIMAPCPIQVSGGPKAKRLIAADSIVFNNPEERWIARYELYKDLKTDSTQLADTLLAQFYTLESQSTMGVLDQVKQAICDSACVINLQNAHSINASVSAVLTPEILSRDINALQIERLLAERDTFTQAELSQIRNIANECPFTHGTAVYEARVIAMQYDPIGTVYYHLCETEENYAPNNRIDVSEENNDDIKGTLVEEALYSYKFYPNPSKGELFFEYQLLPEVKDAQIRISDATGREIKRYNLEPNAKLLQINETSLVNGLYYYSILIDGELKQTEKFVILK